MATREEGEMREHTTHHDDCGCKSARYEAIIDAMQDVIDAQADLLAAYRLGSNAAGARASDRLHGARKRLDALNEQEAGRG